jgi:hypothetical protein
MEARYRVAGTRSGQISARIPILIVAGAQIATSFAWPVVEIHIMNNDAIATRPCR